MGLEMLTFLSTYKTDIFETSSSYSLDNLGDVVQISEYDNSEDGLVQELKLRFCWEQGPFFMSILA